MMCHAGFGGVDPRHERVRLLPRDVRRRLRRPPRERRAGRGAGARAEHRERARRGDRAQLPGARRRGSRSSRTPRAPGRFRGGLGLRKDFLFDRPTTFTVLSDRTAAGPAGAFGGRRRPGRRVRADPGRRGDQAAGQDDRVRRGGRRRQLPHLRRRRLRAAGGARSGTRAARRARGQGQRRARTGRVPRRRFRTRGGRGRDGGAAYPGDDHGRPDLVRGDPQRARRRDRRDGARAEAQRLLDEHQDALGLLVRLLRRRAALGRAGRSRSRCTSARWWSRCRRRSALRRRRGSARAT